ncbi:hypothetical protein CWI36_0230p0020 [Hamiltosporidium magnivora]|uniref:Uncharacterized protein n=1 Tax=Hamiltosporidium magnivora TaxID=148818 RepID=A0A4Q9LHY8_9MICR|nr:hypothetical protein CWI36_0230p0020 [Hamiltosporidium magnivora]
MFRKLYFTHTLETPVFIKVGFMFSFSICFYFSQYLTTVKFFVINEENRLFNFNISNLSSETDIPEYDYLDTLNQEDKITIFKNNISCCKSRNNESEYYIPSIFLRDISYNSLLLFLKLMDNQDNIANKIKIQDFLDILLIISILDIEKSKERKKFIKELLIHFIIEMPNLKQTFDFDKYYDSYHDKNIRRNILMDLWIFLLDIITFDDKVISGYILHTKKKLLIDFERPMIDLSMNIIFLKYFPSKICLRLDRSSLTSLSKILRLKYLKHFWTFISNIIKFYKLKLSFSYEATDKKIIDLLLTINFRTKKLELSFEENPMKLLENKDLYICTKSLKTLKLTWVFTTEELKIFLEHCSNLQRLKICTDLLDFEQLSLLIDFSNKNPKVFSKIFCVAFDSVNIDPCLVKPIPENIVIYLENIQIESNFLEVPTIYKPLFIEYFYRYKYIKNSIFLTDAVSFDISKSKHFVCALNYKCDASKNTIYNQKLKYIYLEDSLSYISTDILIYLQRFKGVIGLKLIKVDIKSTEFDLNSLLDPLQKEEDKIYLTNLEVKTYSKYAKDSNFLHFISVAYDLSKLNEISYHVYNITETDYFYFSKMNCLKDVFIRIRDRTNIVEFCKLFSNCNSIHNISDLNIEISKITKKNIQFLFKIKNLQMLRISCDEINYETIKCFKKKYFKNVYFKIENPNRKKRSDKINHYLDSEFSTNVSRIPDYY